MGKSQKICFLTPKNLIMMGNKMWVCIPWDNTFQLVTAKFQETEFC